MSVRENGQSFYCVRKYGHKIFTSLFYVHSYQLKLLIKLVFEEVGIDIAVGFIRVLNLTPHPPKTFIQRQFAGQDC